jgi:hypothetical protein
MTALRSANLTLSFLLELCLLAAFAYWGFSTQSGTALQIVLGIGTPLLVAVIWGLLLAPRAPVHLSRRVHLLLATVLFAFGALALWAAGQPGLALAFALLYVINTLLGFILKQLKQ